MITEDYVSFETAKLLKENGFNEKCYVNYSSNGSTQHFNYQAPSDGVPCPTLQMAMKWLRDVHNLAVFPTTYYRELGKDNIIHDYGSTIVKLGTFETVGDISNTFEADTYEETAEKAIQYCLENLI